VRGPVTSPTFVIARVHPQLKPEQGLTASGPALVHADAYRLGSVLEMDDLDLDADTETSVTVVEWGEGLAEGLAADRLEVRIAPGPTPGAVLSDPAEAVGAPPEGDSPRTVTIVGVGERWRGTQLPPADLADRL
jgi:tRNA threonylcarbamoyladenosine biosynthesis protein TsaE